jgi:hypothetical protein
MTVNPEKLGREQRAVLQQLALLIARFLVFAMALWTPLASGQNLAALLKSMPAYKAASTGHWNNPDLGQEPDARYRQSVGDWF